MIAVDTNVLVRILIDDESNSEQVKLARNTAKKHRQLYISQIVQAELVWVLDVAFKLDKDKVLVILKHLLENEAFVLQQEDQFENALHYFQISNCDFADCLIFSECNEKSYEIITFDKKFSKLPGVKFLF